MTVVPVCLVDRGGRLMSLWADTVVPGGAGVGLVAASDFWGDVAPQRVSQW
jgi:hypothetical protein